mmetsp:Transcript_5344/g.13183  ORF Transcript_5344/g.13183 Transcript_5344/m.13183 type:complete len:695 (+) Transcript_5344:243-2327(+)
MPHPFGFDEDIKTCRTIKIQILTNRTTMMPSQHHREISMRDKEIVRLQNHVKTLSNQLESAMQQQRQLRRPPQQNDGDSDDKANANANANKRSNKMSPHAVHIQHVDGGKSGSCVIRTRRDRMGRNASFYTRRVMASLPSSEGDRYASHPIVMRIMEMFQRPNEHVEYLRDKLFATDLFKLCQKVRQILEREPRVIYLQSPCYIFGDIHGNLEDLHFFSDNIWRLGMSLTAGNFLFLGDYVDRGMNCLEVVAYLLSMKLQNPHKVFLLRGNHETRDVNGWEEHYGERSFIWQCQERFDRFGGDIGYRIWEACNQVFDRMPLVAVVDQDIFCVHGGIPRPVSMDYPHMRSVHTTRIQDILNVPKVAGINPPYEHEDDVYQQVASDCIWSDPASEEQEHHSVDQNTGYGESLRGGGAICFGNKAVTDFLKEQGFSYIMRAHEAHAEGVAVSKGARVFTVFSTSKDHNQGSQALAGCILVDDEKLQVINRSPAYKNQYVHRRDSISLQTLSHLEIAKRIKLGLVTPGEDDYYDYSHGEEDDEEWEDQSDEDANDVGADDHGQDDVSIEIAPDDDDDDSRRSSQGNHEDLAFAQQQSDASLRQQYTFAENRRSSIDLSQMSANLHDSRSEFIMDGHVTGQSSRSLLGSLRSQAEVIHEAVEEVEDNNDEEEVSTVNGDDLATDADADADANADVSMEN